MDLVGVVVVGVVVVGVVVVRVVVIRVVVVQVVVVQLLAVLTLTFRVLLQFEEYCNVCLVYGFLCVMHYFLPLIVAFACTDPELYCCWNLTVHIVYCYLALVQTVMANA